MKLISWNVNGLRACLTKGFADFFEKEDADFFCTQEVKMLSDQTDYDFNGYKQFWNSADKKGYSGTAVFCKNHDVTATYDIGVDEHRGEGRVVTVDLGEAYLVNVYTPNSKRELLRLDYRMEWEDAFREYVLNLDKQKPVIICGDLNVAHKEIDLKNPKTNTKNAGFTKEEREKMTTLLDSGFVDSFRYLYPDEVGAYSWWSYMFNARAKNAGWRIDYFLVSERIKDKIKVAKIYADVFGSDHCPVGIELDI